jgi:hypothetical protein
MDKNDMVVVLDVTGIPIKKGFTIEKCKNPKVEQFLRKALSGLPYDLYKDCPDPIATEDETDVYRKKTDYTFFLGIPVQGGDYNEGAVTAKLADFEYVKQALIRIAEHYPSFAKATNGNLTAPVYLKPEDVSDYECDYCCIGVDNKPHYTCADPECPSDFILCEDCHNEQREIENHKSHHAMKYHNGDSDSED